MTLTRRKPLARTGRLKPVSDKRRAYWNSPEGKAGLEHMRRVRELPCVICQRWGFVQTSPSEAHHAIHGRYSARKAPDTATLPLCCEHHRESNDPAKIALHANPSRWKREYGMDTDFLPIVADLLAGQMTPIKEGE
ncbi:hypothetical protein ROJ8625_04128 [Roseivivax jejudonensis]|uniref:Recombination enhancement function protein n=1 Tax=Roseivivax jejudonensis TaxID=1529041 RepID=A0A1X7ABX3_9RHOB|nr:Ref family recombination enhancement nuclease [Roseivivax jejudonensis]SLN74934.1 hypothetical protein ROJ8625_04128 [Roseivivax jejudonensis]